MTASTIWNQHRLLEAFTEDEEPDAADLGTAFGMECSLAPKAPARPKVPKAADEIEPDPAD